MTQPTGRPAFSRETTLRLTEGLGALTHLISSVEYLVDDEDRRTGGLNDYEVFRAADRIRSPLAGGVVRIASRPEVTRGLHAARVAAAGVLLLPVGRRARLAADAVLTGTQLALYPRNHYGSDGSDQASFLRFNLLESSGTSTHCPYEDDAVELVAFFDERTTVEVDGHPTARPDTPRR